jgi:hypothetical protein
VIQRYRNKAILLLDPWQHDPILAPLSNKPSQVAVDGEETFYRPDNTPYPPGELKRVPAWCLEYPSSAEFIDMYLHHVFGSCVHGQRNLASFLALSKTIDTWCRGTRSPEVVNALQTVIGPLRQQLDNVVLVDAEVGVSWSNVPVNGETVEACVEELETVAMMDAEKEETQDMDDYDVARPQKRARLASEEGTPNA